MCRKAPRLGWMLAILALPALVAGQEPPEDSAPPTEDGAPLPAQMEGSVIGLPDGQPLPGSLVLLDNGRRSVTDVSGRFAFPGLTAGTYQVAIVAPGCQIAFTAVDLEPWQTRRIGFTVRFELESHAAEIRRRASEGVLVTADEIDEMNARRMSEVIRRVVPNMVGGTSTPGGNARLSSGRGNPSALAQLSPVLVLDGVRMGESTTRALNEIDPHDVAFVEILKGASGGWSYGSEGSGGVIRITTKRGLQSDAPALDPALCELPDWP